MEAKQFPPPGYVQTESAVEGVVVYMPKPPEDSFKDVVSFKCPNCGADRAYSAVDGGLRCANCGYHEVPDVEVVGRAAQEFEFKVETLQRASHGWGVERKELQCQSCGAATSLPPDMLTHTCPFCASENVVQRKAPQDILRPRYLIPPKFGDEACQKLTRDWLGSSWMTPGSLQQRAALSSFAPIYLPYWTFDATSSAAWRAQVGHTRTRRTKNGTQTYTVWKWESGNVRLNIDDLLVSGTTQISEVLLGRVANFLTEDLVPYDPSYLAGIRAQAYERELEEAWDMGRHTMREQTKKACMAQASTNKIRNFSMNLDFSDESWRYVLLPFYVSNYRYEDETYQVVLNAQMGTVAGQRPVAWRKVAAAIAAVLTPGLLVMLFALLTYPATRAGTGPTTQNDNPAQIIGIIGLVLLGLGLVWAFTTVQKAMSFDDV